MGCSNSKSAQPQAISPSGKGSQARAGTPGGERGGGANSPADSLLRASTLQKRSGLKGSYYNSTWGTCVGLLRVLVHGASNMAIVDAKGKNDPFCVISFGHQSTRTRTISNENSPVWDQQAIFAVDEVQKGFLLKLSVFDKDLMTKDDLIGYTTIPISPLLSSPNEKKPMNLTLYLTEAEIQTDDKTKSRGEVKVELLFTPKEQVAAEFWSQLSRIFDQNGDGEISREELDMMLECLGSKATDEQVDMIMKEADEDNSGSVSRDELHRYMHSHEGSKFLDVQQCPVCQSDLSSISDRDIVMHLAQCFEGGPNSAEKFMVGEFLCSEHAVHDWMQSLVGNKRANSYEEVQGKGYILVQVRGTGEVVREKLAPFVTMPLRVMYQTMVGRFAADRARKVLHKISVTSGKKYDDPASAKTIPEFIQYYGLNVDEILLPLTEFKTFNEFFYRRLKPDARPIAGEADPRVIVSPADCRCLVFPTIEDATTLWIKGKSFTLSTLLRDESLVQQYIGGSFMIARLAPQDYHRYHLPVAGKIKMMRHIDGCLFTVSPLAINQDIDVYTENKRMLTLIETEKAGNVLVVTIGATMVGGINMLVKEGEEVKKGDEHGYFSFGGSTELLLFEPGRVKFDDDLLGNSKMPVETLIRVGQSVASAVDVENGDSTTHNVSNVDNNNGNGGNNNNVPDEGDETALIAGGEGGDAL